MKKLLKWLIILLPVIAIVIFIIVAALIPNKASEEKKIKTKEYTAKDGRLVLTADEKFKMEEKGEYDLYLNKKGQQVIGVFTYNVNEYEEKTAKQILDKQVENFMSTRKDMKLFKKEMNIDMEDKTITKVEYSGKTEKSSDCVYILSTISFIFHIYIHFFFK